jgi:hypothetical protein
MSMETEKLLGMKTLASTLTYLLDAVKLHSNAATFYNELFNKLAAEKPGERLDYTPMMRHYQEICQYHHTSCIRAQLKLSELENITDEQLFGR